MTFLSRRCWVLLGLALLGCGDDDDSSGGGPGDGTSIPRQTCNDICVAKATSCNAPAPNAQLVCASLCGQGLSQEQADCLTSKPCSELNTIQDPAGFQKVCPRSSGAGGSGGSGGAGGGTGSGSKFGEACKCHEDSTEGSGRFECSGTNICSSGLTCVGSRTQGVDSGTCVGPVCCTSKEDCAAKLGSSQGCASDQKCACTDGDLECVGDKCTCSGGFVGSQGLCYPK